MRLFSLLLNTTPTHTHTLTGTDKGALWAHQAVGQVRSTSFREMSYPLNSKTSSRLLLCFTRMQEETSERELAVWVSTESLETNVAECGVRGGTHTAQNVPIQLLRLSVTSSVLMRHFQLACLFSRSCNRYEVEAPFFLPLITHRGSDDTPESQPWCFLEILSKVAH